MQILVAVHKDENSVYGVTVPDLPGCFSWGDSIEDAMKNTCEAIYSHVQAMLTEGIPVEIRQSKIEELAADDVGVDSTEKQARDFHVDSLGLGIQFRQTDLH